MTHPVQQLRAILAQAQGPTKGTVVSVAGALARVRTSKGILVYSTAGLSVAPGNSVELSGQSITSVVLPDEGLTIYDV